MIITGVVALFVTAWVLDTGTPPQPQKEAIDNVRVSKPISTRKQDYEQLIGDFKITGGYGVKTYRAGVYDDNDPKAQSLNNACFPITGSAIKI